MSDRYPPEKLAAPGEFWHGDDDDYLDDDGTMPENVAELAKHLIGHRIVSAEKGSARVVEGPYWKGDKPRVRDGHGFVITLDNGEKVLLEDSSDCCAYTSLQAFLLHPELVDHAILGVGTTQKYQRWHIYADMGDVLELEVGWSCGNPFYYGYGFDIYVVPIDGELVPEAIEQ